VIKMKRRWAVGIAAVFALAAMPAFASPVPGQMPTRQMIAYSSMRDGQADVYSMDAFGKYSFNITHDKTIGVRADVQPVWSPSGDLVAFERQYAKGRGADVMVVDSNGKNLHALAPSLQMGTWSCHPSWAMDNTVYFTSNRDGNFDLYSVLASGKGLKQLTKTPGLVQNLAPTVSPDGKFVAFVRTSEVGPMSMTGIYVLNVTNGTVKRVTTAPPGPRDFAPTWSPDGKRIAFASDRLGSNDIWMVNVVGTTPGATTPWRVTWTKSSEVHPAFSPDGRRLAFVGTMSGATEIYSLDLISPAVTNPMQLTFDKAFKEGPSWHAVTIKTGW
jgi:Tol biopolymer transport system component